MLQMVQLISGQLTNFKWDRKVATCKIQTYRACAGSMSPSSMILAPLIIAASNSVSAFRSVNAARATAKKKNSMEPVS